MILSLQALRLTITETSVATPPHYSFWTLHLSGAMTLRFPGGIYVLADSDYKSMVYEEGVWHGVV